MPEITIIEIMKYMGWNYEDYLNCPITIVDGILARMKVESEQRTKKRNG